MINGVNVTDNKWVIGTVGKFSVNRGNLLIDEGFQTGWKLANLPNLHEESIFSNNITKYKNIISVGCTSLCANSGNAGFLNNMDCKIIMAGGSLWNNDSENIAKKCIEPIGTRDPFTDNILRKKGYKTQLIGCPVVFIEPENLTEEYLIVSLPRPRSFNPERFLKTVINGHKNEIIRGVVHEQCETIIFEKFNIPVVKNMKQAYSSAKKIVTGRLHGAILGRLWDKETIYTYDKTDGRNSLWEIDFINLKDRYLSFLSNICQEKLK